MKKVILTILASIFLASCSSAVRFTSEGSIRYNDSNTEIVTVMYGKASYYGSEFEGRGTSSGEIFSNRNYTAAHKSLAFGTLVKVTNISNNKSVIVKVNDRGPFVAGRIIDLSKVAAEELDMIRSGVIEVKIEVLK